MLPTCCVRELQTAWFPHMTDAGLDRVIDLLEKASPLLISGCFSKAASMGCLATHIAWQHPQTEHLDIEAGVAWLTRVAGLNPATSQVIREWDTRGAKDWTLREDLLRVFLAERKNRARLGDRSEHADETPVPVAGLCTRTQNLDAGRLEREEKDNKEGRKAGR
jgi:hypothetical protein